MRTSVLQLAVIIVFFMIMTVAALYTLFFSKTADQKQEALNQTSPVTDSVETTLPQDESGTSDISNPEMPAVSEKKAIDTAPNNGNHVFITHFEPALGYQISYPSDWVIDQTASGPVFDKQNKIVDQFSVAATDGLLRLTVRVDLNELLLLREAPSTTTVTIEDEALVAYLFPRGYECTPSSKQPTCSFGVIPLKRDLHWFYIYLIGDVHEGGLDSSWQKVLDSFSFSEPEYLDTKNRVTLSSDGLGVVKFGESASSVTATLNDYLGLPSTSDLYRLSGWSSCNGGTVLAWNNLKLFFTPKTFLLHGWRYEELVNPNLLTPALYTSHGITLGSTQEEVISQGAKQIAQSAAVNTYEFDPQQSFTASQVLQSKGLISLVTNNKVSALVGGGVCDHGSE